MKIVFVCGFLILTVIGFSQSITLNSLPLTSSENNKWDINRYVWSRSHIPGKSDKPNLDFDAIDNFTQLDNTLSVSPDGKYFSYGMFSGTGEFKKNETLTIQSTNGSWKKSFLGAKIGFFSTDSKQYVFRQNDGLCFLKTGSNHLRTVGKVISWKQSTQEAPGWIAYQVKNNENTLIFENLLSGVTKNVDHVANYNFDKSGKWLACQLKNENKELIIYNLVSGSEKRYPFVESYAFSNIGESLVNKVVSNQNGESKIEIQYITLNDGTLKKIWSTTEKDISIQSYYIDNSGQQLAFVLKCNSAKQTGNSIWYYKKGMDKSVMIVSNQTSGIKEGASINGPISFTSNSTYIQFSVELLLDTIKPDVTGVQLDVWNYKDSFLQSAQIARLSRQPLKKSYKAFINPEVGKVVCIGNDYAPNSLIMGDFVMVQKLRRELSDRFWDESIRDSTWVISLQNGSRRFLSTSIKSYNVWVSPNGNYLVYFDSDSGAHYFSYDLNTGQKTKISTNVLDIQLAAAIPYLRGDSIANVPWGVAAWNENKSGVFVYDKNDIWQLDLKGKKPALNITNGYGASHRIIFSLIQNARYGMKAPVLKSKQSLLLRSFDTENKSNGFYSGSIDVADDPILLFKGPYFTSLVPGFQDNLSNEGLQPIKAKNADIWIVQRQSSVDAPNYFLTKDFKTFKRLTNYQPHKNYNWLTEELHTFKHLNGKSGQGVLYKPENFDSTKRYPVLIVSYVRFSNNLNQFNAPEYNQRPMTPGESPIWFLNNGYLVFTPDIYVTPLKYGPEAFNVIEGAANYLKQFPYVDSNGLGLCSHSWGAKLAAYVFTHSSSFGATALNEGFVYANLINVAFSNDESGNSELQSIEKGFQYGDFWTNKESWLDQTTILNVDKANSPLLLTCNKASPNLDQYANQTLQLFTALRRLDKKVWWLHYAKAEHNLEDLDEQKDYTIRYTQYFDHYLKLAPAPRWMTQGIPYEKKGLDYGFELDPSGNCGKDCKICIKWNEQYTKTPEMFTKPISEWKLDEIKNLSKQ